MNLGKFEQEFFSMVKTIVWDLEGVLIVRSQEPEVHPDAVEVLERSRQDFDRVYLWTRVEIRRAYEILRYKGLLKYFDRLVCKKTEREGLRDYMIGIENGRFSGMAAYLSESEHDKDLRLLGGDVGDKILIEDVMRFTKDQINAVCMMQGVDPALFPDDKRVARGGYPLERVVHIETYRGDNPHSLVIPYEEALKR